MGIPDPISTAGSKQSASKQAFRDEKGFGYFKAQCEKLQNYNCLTYGQYYLEGRGVKADALVAAEIFASVCTETNKTGCFELGKLYINGIGVPKDEGRAATIFADGCKTDEVACAGLGYLHETGRGVDPDLGKARDLYVEACAKRVGFACFNLARMYRDGSKVARDEASALKWFRTGCETGCLDACVEFRRLR